MQKASLISLFVLVFTFFSCSTDYKIIESVESISLTADSSIKIIGETIVFTVNTNNGTNVTEDAKITVNSIEIEGNTFTSDEVSSYVVQAEYYGVLSEPLTISFQDGSEINFVKNVLIEDYTGTWCGNCPRVAHAIELAKQQSNQVISVAIHRSSSNPADANYDPYNFDSSELETYLGMSGYPKALLNRMTRWQPLEQNNITQVINLTQGENPKLGLAITSEVTATTINLGVDVKFSKDFEGLNLVVYILEDGLIYDQVNYTNFYGGAATLINFQHDHVLKSCLTPLFGMPIASSETTVGKTYSKSFSLDIPANIANKNKIEFVAFITGADNKTINSRKASPNVEQTFEEL
ncbi:Omp28-related outer membrane protein [Flavobacterium sp.]|uniref:Omp28-related outer membrane protein n=1 Tax=Flavobacterium sp. TaxID=239 RepID=UPI00262BEFBC|nr:Omp28-related outer membrane protein [Flavobacterium sp.]MDD2985853.1 Omp28-related outer membrane protein [Flavobacterium sp.]